MGILCVTVLVGSQNLRRAEVWECWYDHPLKGTPTIAPIEPVCNPKNGTNTRLNESLASCNYLGTTYI